VYLACLTYFLGVLVFSFVDIVMPLIDEGFSVTGVGADD
jgi:hypothetical protein